MDTPQYSYEYQYQHPQPQHLPYFQTNGEELLSLPDVPLDDIPVVESADELFDMLNESNVCGEVQAPLQTSTDTSTQQPLPSMPQLTDFTAVTPEPDTNKYTVAPPQTNESTAAPAHTNDNGDNTTTSPAPPNVATATNTRPPIKSKVFDQNAPPFLTESDFK